MLKTLLIFLRKVWLYMNVMFCSNCNKTGLNQFAILLGNGKKSNFHKGFLYPFEFENKPIDICPYCKNSIEDTNLSEDDFDLIDDVSDSDRQFLEAMIELKKKDPIEYQLKMSQFKANLGQQEISKPKEDNTLRCPTCNSTKVKKISATSKVVGASMFGLFSKTARSQFKCEQCGYKW